MHAQAEHGLAAHWAYKQGKRQRPEDGAGELDPRPGRDLRHAGRAEELLEHTRLAIYQDRIFAFTPKGELFQLPKGATPVDFAYAVHTDLGDQTVGAKINGRHMPLRTQLKNGDLVEIMREGAGAAALLARLRRHRQGARRDPPRGAARSATRRSRLAANSSRRSSSACRRRSARRRWPRRSKRLDLDDEEELMEAIAPQASPTAGDGGAGAGHAGRVEAYAAPAGARDLDQGADPGHGLHLAECCHPVPGDRIVGLRRRARGSRSTRSTAERSPAGSTPTGSTCRGATDPMAAPRGSIIVIQNEAGSLAPDCEDNGRQRRQYRQPRLSIATEASTPSIFDRSARRTASDADPCRLARRGSGFEAERL